MAKKPDKGIISTSLTLSEQLVYDTRPNGGAALITRIRLCNENTVKVKIRYAITGGSAPEAKDYEEYDRILYPNEGADLLCKPLQMVEGMRIYLYANKTGVSYAIYTQ
jgi:hypothetical protein